MADPLLDCERIRRLRLEAGLTHGALARALGVSAPAARALENSRAPNHHQLNLSILKALSTALGVPASHLFRSEPDWGPRVQADPETDLGQDVERLGALVAAAEGPVRRRDVAFALGWSEARVWSATNVLVRRLAGVGQRLPAGGASLRALPRKELVDPAQLKVVERAILSRESLRLNEAVLLRRVLAGQIDGRWEGQATNAQRVSLSRLLRLGLIEKEGSRYQLTKEASYSLQTAGGHHPPASGASELSVN